MSYGLCPHCSADVVSRERRIDGNDTCSNGHVFPSKATIPNPTVYDKYRERVKDLEEKHKKERQELDI